MPYFFQAVAAHPSEIIRDYVMLSLLTGQRQANVLAMEWSELDLSNAIWRIPRSKTKTTREYVVPLVSEVIEILQRRGEAVGPFSRFVLPGSGKTGHLAEAKSGWKRILLRAQLLGLMDVIAETKGWSKDRTEQERKVAELSLPEAIETYRGQVRALNVDPDKFIIKDLRMHDLRRTLASWQAITGANLVAISKTLNHSNIATTGIYARMQIDPVRQAISTAAGAMFEAGGVGKVAPVINLPQGDRNPIAA
jgi:integrase